MCYTYYFLHFTGDYLGNQCAAQPGTPCIPCRERLPSCVGRPNGRNYFPGRELTENYIQCLDNRTLRVGSCAEGYYDPGRGSCRTEIGAGKLTDVHNRKFLTGTYADEYFDPEPK